uniref:VanZ family protein n=1 Tax=Conyzicola sp. TaxID=1969404 RepID=UPI0039899F35
IAMLLPYRLSWFALVVGPAMSIAIELVQAIAFSARFASVGDVIANSTGAFIGAGLAFALRTVVRRLERETVGAALRQAKRPSP